MNRECFAIDNPDSNSPWHLVEEINHRVVNEYGHAIALLALAARRSSSADAQDALSAAAGRLRAYADTHRALLPPLGTGTVSLSDYLGRYCTAALKASLAETGVKITLQADDVRLPADRCWRVGLIVAELVGNAFRHGLAGGKGAIVIALRERPGILCCEVRDDGRGATEPAIGRGRRLMRSIAAELGGSIDWTFTPHGSVARLCVPVP